jgi:hypothetical protein
MDEIQRPLSGVKESPVESQSDAGITETAPVKETEQTKPDSETTEGQAKPGKGQGKGKPAKAPDKPESEESFFDPSTLSEELIPAYKQLQAAYTKKTQALSKDREKIQAYDAFMSNPVENLTRAAQQYGYKLQSANAPAAQGAFGGNGSEPFGKDWQPQTWSEVRDAMLQVVTQGLSQKFAPLFEGMQRLTTSTVESKLNEIDSNWKMYEDEMTENLRAHPSLANDVSKLYRISVPEEVLRNKYTQAALKKYEEKAQSAKISSQSSVRSSSPPKNKKLTFSEAVEEAKRQLGM